MATLIPTLKRALGTPTGTVRECRHCGTRVDATAQRCSACGHDGIAEYLVD